MPRRLTVARLAQEADAEVDEVLVALWDAGIDAVEGPADTIELGLVKRARSALGVTSIKEQTSVAYWSKKTGLAHPELAARLSELGITLSPRARTLPKGALVKLRRQFPDTTAPVVDDMAELAPCPDFIWSTVGRVRSSMCYLDESEVTQIHASLVADFAEADDPISPPGVRSENLLSSALGRPQTSHGNELKYPTIELAAAALLHSLVMNHPFHNGNKRTGLVATLVFLDSNGLLPTCDEEALFRLVLRIAQHGLVPPYCPEPADREVLEIAKWIHGNTRVIEKGERPIPWLRLKRILRDHGCEFDLSSSVGNRINLRRAVQVASRFGRGKTRVLSIQVAYGDDGREVERNALNSIRHALELDEAHGVDSKVFYESQALPDDFIQLYRTLLRRLSRI